MMINHKITPLLLTPTGKVWLALCTVALSSRKEPGHIYFRILGQSSHKEYDLDDHSWHTCEAIILKPEEKQILTLAAQGFTTKEIGEQLFRSENTVKFYRKALFEKLEVTSITEALAFATNYGLI
jgi:DNA-binding NarL/FixJ family response regulator